MAITVSNNSIETLTNLIRKEYDSIDSSMEYIYKKGEKLIEAAKDFGLHELAEELQNDNN